MSRSNKAIVGCLGVIALALVAAATLVVLNWDSVSENLAEQSEKTRATLFRWGELMSIGAELKARYGVEPEVTYDTADNSDRTLSIAFSDYGLPPQTAARDHAREIAVFAIGKTAKAQLIDAVTVSFRNPPTTGGDDATGGSGSYTFTVEELRPGQP